ncbi:MAG: IS21 family transposase [Mariniphaga sp.]
MTLKDLNNWIMYHELQRMKRLGFSQARIARFLEMDPRTVGRYLKMNEDEFECFLLSSSERCKILDPYEDFVIKQLRDFPDTSAAQMHDWLKEHHGDFPEVTPRTVYNFVMHIRQKHNIPYVVPTRDFFPVEDLPYGRQSQVDFGEYNMRMTSGKRKKVFFFAMVLSRSRMKFTVFNDTPFTTEVVIDSHEKAFRFFGGMPIMVVFDMDKTIITDENLGDYILTSSFKQYAKTRNFEMYFCRKSDPQSKGKVENVIQYIKKNFLYNRVYHDIETLNDQAIAWLNRTANHLPHNYTKKSPEQEFLIEQQFLKPYIPLTLSNNPKMDLYTVRKHNAIAYKGNFYTLPQGTYQGPDTKVLVYRDQEELQIYDPDQNLICTHRISSQKGKTISNTNHKRDTSVSLDKMATQVALCFTNKDLADNYIQRVKQKYPRYLRDHLQVILKSLNKVDVITADKTLAFCIKNKVFHGHEFNQVLSVFLDEKVQPKISEDNIKLLGNKSPNIDQVPQTSNIEDYENIVNH